MCKSIQRQEPRIKSSKSRGECVGAGRVRSVRAGRGGEPSRLYKQRTRADCYSPDNETRSETQPISMMRCSDPLLYFSFISQQSLERKRREERVFNSHFHLRLAPNERESPTGGFLKNLG